MLPTQTFIDRLADQIEHAYALRSHSRWDGYAARGVWTAAATRLWQVHVDHPELPLDPCLFVAAQRLCKASGNPWSQLTEPQSGTRYRTQVNRIIKMLMNELLREVLQAERSIAKGRDIETLLLNEHPKLSPLGQFIVAQRADRPDLAAHLAEAATLQHQSCPLYRNASRSLIPADLYPVDETHPAETTDSTVRDTHQSTGAAYKAHLMTNHSNHLNN